MKMSLRQRRMTEMWLLRPPSTTKEHMESRWSLGDACMGTHSVRYAMVSAHPCAGHITHAPSLCSPHSRAAQRSPFAWSTCSSLINTCIINHTVAWHTNDITEWDINMTTQLHTWQLITFHYFLELHLECVYLPLHGTASLESMNCQHCQSGKRSIIIDS